MGEFEVQNPDYFLSYPLPHAWENRFKFSATAMLPAIIVLNCMLLEQGAPDYSL